MKLLLTAMFFLFASFASATVDQYQFDSSAEQDSYMALIEELRCPKCQNQNLADSNAEIAQDMRNEVFRLMREGMSNQEITDYLVARYGDFVRYKPPLNAQTSVLWLLPAILLFIAVIIVVFIARSQSVKKGEKSLALSDEEKNRLNKINGDGE